MKEGWEYIEFKNVFPIKMGKTPPRGDKSSWDTEKRTKNKWVSIADISINEGKTIYDTKEYISDSAANKLFKVTKGSLLMSFKLSIGRMAFAGDDLYTNEAIIAIPECKDYNLRFIYYYLSSYNWMSFTEGNEKVKGATLNKSSIGKIKLPVIDMTEQQSIVDYLDSAFAKIDAMKANAEKALNEAKALFQASLKKMLEPKEGWEEKKLGEITTKISDGSHNPPAGLDFSEYEMLSSKNIRNDLFNFDNPRFLSKEDFEKEDKRTNLEKGDVLLTIVGAGLGECCVYNFEKKIVFQRSVSVIKPSYDKIKSRFLMYILQKNYNSIRNKSNGAAQKGIYLKQLAAYAILIPPLSEQQSIVAFLDSLKSKVDRLQENFDKISQECDALKQAILRQVFE